MAEISTRALVMVIQAVEAEVRRLRALPEAQTVPGDEVLLVDYETVAEELKDLYDEALARQPNLPQYSQLVGRAE